MKKTKYSVHIVLFNQHQQLNSCEAECVVRYGCSLNILAVKLEINFVAFHRELLHGISYKLRAKTIGYRC